MHILIAAHDCYPDPGSGGTGRYVYETAKRLVEYGHDVTVITRRRGPVPSRESLAGIDLYRFDITIAEQAAPTILPQLIRATTTVSRQIQNVIQTTGLPDILSYQGPVTSALVERAIGDETIPRVATFHSPWPVEYGVKTHGPEGAVGLRRHANIALRWFVENSLLARTDQLVTLSEFMREKLLTTYGGSRTITVIPGGVDTDQFTPNGPASEQLEGDPVFLTVRRLSKRMGHEDLITAFAAVTNEYPDAQLYIAGDGPLRPYLESVARASGVDDSTTFLGYVPDETLPRVYRSADVFVLPTRELEGFGLATLEALSSGVPVVATPVGGTVELLAALESDESVPASMLFSAVTTEALAAGLLEWAALDTERHLAVSRACRRYVRDNFRWDDTVSTLETRYRDLRRDRELDLHDGHSQSVSTNTPSNRLVGRDGHRR